VGVSGASDDPLVRLFDEAERGDKGARDALFTALYDELHRLAEVHLHRSGGRVTLTATTLLHEAYLDIAQRRAVAFPSRPHFLAYASRAMRGLITDYVRRRHALKRGGELIFAPLDETKAATAETPVDLDALGRALDELAALDQPLAQLVDLKFFCGLTFGEIATLRGVSERTIQRDWAKARLLLHQKLDDRA
jgi:RNA polymerase sigma factor (TIGR02999 family)